jgi:hypothetical protein
VSDKNSPFRMEYKKVGIDLQISCRKRLIMLNVNCIFCEIFLPQGTKTHNTFKNV